MMEPKTLFYQCEICKFQGYLEHSPTPLHDANCPGCNSLLFPSQERATPSAQPRNRAWPALRTLIAIPILIGAVCLICWLVSAILTPTQDVWIYVNGPPEMELAAFVDGKPTSLYPKAGNQFRCRSGTRVITIKQGDTTVFHETKTLRPPQSGNVSKYLLSARNPGLYYTFELEYTESQSVWNKLLDESLILDNANDNSLLLIDEIRAKKKQEQISKTYRRQLESLRKLRLQFAEGNWVEVDDCYYVLQYPPSVANLKPPKTKVTIKTIIASPSPDHYDRLRKANHVLTPSQEDVKFLGDFLFLIQNSGGSTEPYTE